MKLWILTQEYNLYDQLGEYFIEAYDHLPTFEELTSVGVPTNRVKAVQLGGGRKDQTEYTWFYLRTKEFNQTKEVSNTPN